MADRNHPSAKPAARTVLNLGNLPPKKQGFGAAAQYARTPSRVDPNNPPWPAYRGYHEFSFAHVSCCPYVWRYKELLRLEVYADP